MLQHNPKVAIPQCTICKSQFDAYYHTPRVLPKCGHTYCEKCITSKLVVKNNRKNFICPQCSAQAVVRKSVAQDLPKNIGVLDIVRNLKKYSTSEPIENNSKNNNLTSPQKTSVKFDEKNVFLDIDSDLKQKQVCSLHNRPLDIFCQTCNYSKICSSCILFGEHKSHSYTRQMPTHVLSTKQITQFKKIYEQSLQVVEQLLLPSSTLNIRKTMQERVCEGLKAYIRQLFRPYYEIIEKKQFEAFQECESVVINEGGIDKNIDQLLKQYDKIKEQYEYNWKLIIENNNKAIVNSKFEEINTYLSKCEQLMIGATNVQDFAYLHIDSFVKNIGTKISGLSVFKLQQTPFSLKKIIETKNGCQPLKSPEKRQKTKTSKEAKAEQIVKIQKVSESSERPIKTVTKTTSLTKSKNSQTQFSNATSNYDSKQKKVEVNEFIAKSSLPPKRPITRQNAVIHNDSLDLKNVEIATGNQMSKRSSINTELSPGRISNLTPNKAMSPQMQEIKFIGPTKQISYSLVSKLNELKNEVDKQSSSSTLEMVGLEMNDVLLQYLLNHMKTRQYSFSVIKFVKNNITDEGLKMILGFLLNDSTTRILNLTSNQLTSRSLDIIVMFASKQQFLRRFYLSNNKITNLNVKSKLKQFQHWGVQITL